MSSKSILFILFAVLISGWIRSGEAEDQTIPRWLRPNQYKHEELRPHIIKRRQANNQINNIMKTYPWTKKGYYIPISLGLSTRFVQLNAPKVSFNTSRFGDDEPVWSVEEDNSPKNQIPPMSIDYNKEFFDTPTGISLEPVRPLRPNARPPPPILHGSNANPQEAAESSKPKSSEDSPCIRAKGPCCNRGLDIRSLDQCFTRNGCPGPFYENPCLKDGSR